MVFSDEPIYLKKGKNKIQLHQNTIEKPNPISKNKKLTYTKKGNNKLILKKQKIGS